MTTNSHAEAAQARVQELRQWRETIPYFVIPTTSRDSVKLISAGSVPPEFVELTAVAVANQKSLVRGESATPEEVRDLMRYADAYDPLADELEAMAQFVRHSTMSARNKAGFEALTTYSLAQRMAKRAEHAALRPHVADMRRALGRVPKLTPEQKLAKKAKATDKANEQTANAPQAPEPQSKTE
ncbi:MAG TPA: hypothetical protein VF057_10765 [Thermoanaerobaculia bacterium]